MEEIDLKELFEFIKSKISLLLIITISVCLIGCIYGLLLQKPMYKSSTTVFMVGKDSGITQSDVNLNKNLISTFAEIVKSRRVLSQVIEELKLDISYGTLTGQISVSALNNTEIIKITVSNKDAAKAKEIANSTANYFVKEVSDLYKLNNISVLDEAIEAKSPYNINVAKQFIMYFAAGIVLSLGVLFIIFYFDRTIKTTTQIEDKTKLPILGVVQDISKGGKKNER